MEWLIARIGGPTILIFIGGIITAVGAVWAAYEQNLESDRLVEKNDEIVRLNQVINDSIIGGDSYCYLEKIANIDNAFIIAHVGKYPLYDVSMRIQDLDKMKDGTLSSTLGKTIPVGNLAPNQAQMISDVTPLNNSVTRLLVTFSARNGMFYERLRIFKISSGNWASALDVNHLTGNPSNSTGVVFTKISPDYPKLKDGSVDWN